MCQVGGGANRCLKHNPVSKFVVKVVTVRTKADEVLVDKTLGELNKEGKKLPSPAPEEVKNWIDTEKFSAQYDPALSEHDRKIQLNRLNRAETENVSGGHFHAWKNLDRAVRSKMSQKLAAAGLVIGMSASLVGCFANGNAPQPHDNLNPPTSISQVTGSGEKIQTPTGSYEKITYNEDAPIYKFNNGNGNTPEMEAKGWSLEDSTAAQKVAVNYMTKEFIDSTALEGGDEAFKEWHSTTAKNYYSDAVYNEIANNPGETKIILGNFGQNKFMPNLIHDGTPREKSLDLTLNGYGPYNDQPGYDAVMFSIEYTAEYRVDDANAAEFIGKHTPTPMSGAEVIQSKYAKDSLKDGSGENVYRAKGYANIVVAKEAGGFKIIGFQSKADFDTTDFANPDA